MEIVRRLVAPVDAATLFAHVDDLAAYEAWMPLVHDVHRLEATTSVDGAVDRPAWSVELRARVGPLARSKRLRMERTALEPERLVRFDRQEADGREHAPWVLRAELDPITDGTELTMRLSYGGSLWAGAALERVLDDQVRRGSERLLALVTAA